MQADALPSGPKLPLDPIPDNLVREPVEYLFADHVRQRSLCGLLKALAEDANAAMEAGFTDVLDYLHVEYANHMADEEEELYPRLRARFGQDTGLLDLLDELEAEHERNSMLGVRVAEGLRRLTDGPGMQMPESVRASIKVFVSNVTAHLATEDERILPLARSSLDDRDMEDIGRAIARRRGIDYPA